MTRNLIDLAMDTLAEVKDHPSLLLAPILMWGHRWDMQHHRWEPK